MPIVGSQKLFINSSPVGFDIDIINKKWPFSETLRAFFVVEGADIRVTSDPDLILDATTGMPAVVGVPVSIDGTNSIKNFKTRTANLGEQAFINVEFSY
jgi:hypothetical protein